MPAEHRADIDHELARLLLIHNQVSGRSIQHLSPAEARSLSDETSSPARRAWSVPSIEDHLVPGPAGPVRVRTYHPRPGETRPLVVFFHGGGWVLGSVDGHDAIARRLCLESDAVVVSVDYRLAPEHPFPAAAEDAIAATRHLLDHAADFGGDPARVAVAGDSAGGHLAAVAALGTRGDDGSPLTAQYLIYPITDFDFERESMRSNASGKLLETEGMKWFWNHFCPDPSTRTDWRASPLRASSHEGLPPAIVTLAAHDPLFDEGLAYARRLEDAGIQTTVRIARDLVHGYISLEDASDRCHRRTTADHQAFAAILHGHRPPNNEDAS